MTKCLRKVNLILVGIMKLMIPNYPKLAGQHASYIEKQLGDFKAKHRNDPVMSSQAVGLSDQDVADLAAFFAFLSI